MGKNIAWRGDQQEKYSCYTFSCLAFLSRVRLRLVLLLPSATQERLRQELVFGGRVVKVRGDAEAAPFGQAGEHKGDFNPKFVIEEGLAGIDLAGLARRLKFLGQQNCRHGAEHTFGTGWPDLPG